MKKFFIVLTLTLVLGVSLCGCLQWLEIPDEHYSQASLVEAPKKESPLLGLSCFLPGESYFQGQHFDKERVHTKLLNNIVCSIKTGVNV